MDNTQKKEKSVHAGHRKRLRELVEKVGLENLNQVQALEFVLTYVLPRKNTNEIAHELIKMFGSFSGVLDAPEHELKQIKHLGQESSRMLAQMKHIYFYYNMSKQKLQKKLSNVLEINAYFYNMLRDADKENLYALALDSSGNIKSLKRLAVGSDKLVTFELSELASFMYNSKSNYLVLCHNHPHASCLPSKRDDEATNKIKNWINALGMRLVDHVVVGKEGTFSFDQVKVFEHEELENAFKTGC